MPELRPESRGESRWSDQKVTGHPYYDTIAVHVVDASSVELIKKKNGKTMLTQTDTVQPDGNTLTEKFTDQTEARPVTGEVILSRISKAPAGVIPYRERGARRK